LGQELIKLIGFLIPGSSLL